MLRREERRGGESKKHINVTDRARRERGRGSEVCVSERGMEVRVREVRGMPAYLLLQLFLSLVQIPRPYSPHCWCKHKPSSYIQCWPLDQ